MKSERPEPEEKERDRERPWNARMRFLALQGLVVVNAAFFLVLLVTGVLLGVYYNGSYDGAYESMQEIIWVTPFGRIVRSVHLWAGHGLVVGALLQLLLFLLCGWRNRPEVLIWRVDLGTLVLVFAAAYTGMLLPLDQVGYWSTVVGSHLLAGTGRMITELGIPPGFNPPELLSRLLFPSGQIDDAVFLRFRGLHTLLVPAGIAACLFVRLRVLRGAGTAIRLTSYGTVFLVVTAALLLLADLGEIRLGEKADPAAPDNPMRATWFFRPFQEFVSHSEFIGGLLLPLGVFAFLWFAPRFFVREVSEVPVRRGVLLNASGGSILFGAIWTVIWVQCADFRMSDGPVISWWHGFIVALVAPVPCYVLGLILWSLGVGIFSSCRRLAVLSFSTCVFTSFGVLVYVVSFHRGPDWQLFLVPSQWVG